MTITWKGSPNFWANRKYGGKQYSVKKIVIHWFGAGTLESANQKFQNPAAQSSAHYGISQGRIWQWVRETDAAWHAGNALVNLESIGIEHDANPNRRLSEQDYKNSAQLVADIAARHNIPLDRAHVIKHGEVKPTQCPGTIDLDRIIREAQAILTPPLQMAFDAVRRTGTPTVYAVAGNALFPFNSPEAFLGAGGKWEKVRELGDADFYKYTVLDDTPIFKHV